MKTSQKLALDFVNHIFELRWEEKITEFDWLDIFFVSDNPYWTLCYWDYFFSMDDVYECMFRKYSPNVMLAYYDYNTYYVEHKDYYLSLTAFVGMYDGRPLDKFYEEYRTYRDKINERNKKWLHYHIESPFK